MQILGLYHRVDGIHGYQEKDGSFVAVLKAPKSKIRNLVLKYRDQFDWDIVEGENYAWNFNLVQKEHQEESDDAYDYFTFQISSSNNRFRYAFKFEYDNKEYYYGEQGVHLAKFVDSKFNYHHEIGFTWSYSSTGKYNGTPDWWKFTNWYQILPDRFNNHRQDELNQNPGRKHAGGNIRGITEKLDYVQKLGFNGIYLNPLFKSPSYHKYNTTDYFEIDEKFGTMKDFDELIKEAKKRNIKVMLDGVFNHFGASHKFWVDVIKNKQNSKYKDWFEIFDFDNIKPPHKYDFNWFIENKPYETFGNTPFMPRLNWSNPEVRDYIRDIISFWLDKGIDAWRMDVADEVTFELWRYVRQELNINYPNSVLLGEVWFDSQLFLQGDQFHSVMNYNYRFNALELLKNNISVRDFVHQEIRRKYLYSKPIHQSLLNLMGSHDVARIFTVLDHSVSRTNFIFAWLMFSPSPILFYYADELHFPGGDDPLNRIPYPWKTDYENHDGYGFIKSLLEIRNNNLNLILDGFKFSKVSDDGFEINFSDKLFLVMNFNNLSFEIRKENMILLKSK